ncbi:alpha/beta hydrolase [Sulfitobacter sp. G21635-S1]|uniref:alpha/beta fold hydrolase n=1 Tax=Sulfitobacter sp. G21635-S1 TaxID=3014043 RepID=UPI0022AE803D|nr:alpha/beta hydrolase [Sulfitobacter sp. G21635-S1]MCZ4259056.1 alpha/beta hydrolase [Sulfitobacter sp. G21635-S1]
MPLACSADPDMGLPPLLMVHGLLVSRRLWEPNKRLALSFRRIRVDLPAHGDSGSPRSAAEAQPEYLVRQLDALRQELGIERWHLCGQSFGAGLVLRYALDLPQHSGALVFTNANAALRHDWPDELKEANAKRINALKANGTDALRGLPYHPVHARRFPAELRAALTRDADGTDPDGLALLLGEGLPRLSVQHRLQELRVPAMLINGVKETKFQPIRNWLSRMHPSIGITDLEGGHSVNVDCSAAFDSAVCDFLGKVPL